MVPAGKHTSLCGFEPFYRDLRVRDPVETSRMAMKEMSREIWTTWHMNQFLKKIKTRKCIMAHHRGLLN